MNKENKSLYKNSERKTYTQLDDTRRQEIIINILSQAKKERLKIEEIIDAFKKMKHDASEQAIRSSLKNLSDKNRVSVTVGEKNAKSYGLKDKKNQIHNVKCTVLDLQMVSLAFSMLKNLGPESLEEFIDNAQSNITIDLPIEIQRDFARVKELQIIRESTLGKSIHENKEDMEKVLDALREKRVLAFDYETKNKESKNKEKTRTVGPIELAFFGGSPYLLGEDQTDKNEKNIKWFRVCRMKKIEMLSSHFEFTNTTQIARDFKNSYSGFGGPCREEALGEDELEKQAREKENKERTPVLVRIVGDKVFADHFQEFKIHSSQTKAKEISDGKFEIFFNMIYPQPVVRYFASFGEHIELIENVRKKDDYKLWNKVKAIWRDACIKHGPPVLNEYETKKQKRDVFWTYDSLIEYKNIWRRR